MINVFIIVYWRSFSRLFEDDFSFECRLSETQKMQKRDSSGPILALTIFGILDFPEYLRIFPLNETLVETMSVYELPYLNAYHLYKSLFPPSPSGYLGLPKWFNSITPWLIYYSFTFNPFPSFPSPPHISTQIEKIIKHHFFFVSREIILK